MKQLTDTEIATGVRTVISRLVKQIRRRTSAVGHLSLTEHTTLTTLYQHGQLLPSELSAMEKSSSQAMSQVLNHLCELGYITKTASLEDKRKTIVSITAAGEEAVRASRQEKEEWLAKAIRETFTKEEKIIIGEAIALLTKLADFE